MSAKSFRDILSEILEEETPLHTTSSEGNSRHPESNFSFSWSPPPMKSAPKRHSYPAPRPRKKPEPPPERTWEITALSAVEQASVLALRRLGASELKEKITQTAVKKAYRRLARALHPDVAGGGPERFIALQEAYQTLSEGLKARLSASACGSESASAEASRHPAAA